MEFDGPQGASGGLDTEDSAEEENACSYTAVAGPSKPRVRLSHSPVSEPDSLQCMALDSDFSDEDEDFVGLKPGHQATQKEVGPLLRSSKVSTCTSTFQF